ncbi:zinc finger CCCH domain-containing protein 55-like isoform X2 [Hordeum vulgare subsp. vulgare]|uniref:zinc finger CCCH domain-containing protein 55-like isoform X2 n=1 Tax=Hordeum vulgare subsp. vulgare TaxID=112509 RepID=UPI001D1A5A94|nr:zinc finger CCCH domain-containing protein 55-like isoform X2 [Hordeum vulgare subsp. vulgare]
MAGVARKGRSKWDTQEISPDIVEISEDDSPPKNTDDRRKDGGDIPTQDLTNDNGKRVGESSNLKPDAFMHQGSTECEEERTDGLNKDVKERQSKASSERSHAPRMAEEGHNNDDWGKLALEKTTGNQGMSRNADDRRRGDGWGTAVSRGYSSRVSSGPDAWKQRTRSPSPRGGTEVTPEAGVESEVEGEAEVEVGVLTLTVVLIGGLREAEYLEDLLCSAEILQLVDAEEACIAGFLMKMVGEGSLTSLIPQTRGKGMAIRTRISWIHENQMTMYGAGNLEVILMKVLGKDLNPEEITGLLINAMSLSKEGAAEVQVADMFMMSPLLMLDGEMMLGKRLMTEHRREPKRPCKFFAEGRCRRGETCPYLHEDAPQSQMGPGASDEPPKYSGGRTPRGNYSNWGEETNGTHAGSHILSRDDRENPDSQHTARSDTGYGYKNRQLEDAGRDQYQIIPQEDFGSQGRNKPEMAAPKQQQFLSPIQTSGDSMNNDKVSGMDGLGASATTGNLSMQTGRHAPNLLDGQSLSQIAQSQDAVPQTSGAPIHPVTSQQQDSTSMLPFNNQQHESNFSLHPNRQDQFSNFSLHPSRQDQFVASQATANNSAPSMQNQPVAVPYMGQGPHSYTLGSQALPAFSGHTFSVAGQVPQDRPTPFYAGQSQATVERSNPSQEGGTQSMQNTHSFQPVAPNMQAHSQALQGLSAVPNQGIGTQSIHNTHNFQPVASPYMQNRGQTLQGLSILPSSTSAAMSGAPPVPPNEEEIRRSLTSLAATLRMQPGTVAGLQLPQTILNPSLMTSLSDVEPSQWSWVQQQQAGTAQPAQQQQAGTTQLAQSEQQAPQQTLPAPSTAVGTSNGNPAPQLVGQTAATSVVTAPPPSENKKVETKAKDSDGEQDGDKNKKGNKEESKALKMFKLALADFVKDALKPTWKEGQLTREVHKTIVKKVVDKVTSTVENIPPTKEKIDVYMSYSKEKLSKLVQAYVGKYVKA